MYLALSLGGALGAITRYFLYQLTANWDTVLPYPTLIINLLGCFILGFFFTITLDYLTLSPTIRTGFGTGFVGSFTTFSTFSVENVHLLQQGYIILSLVYMFASLIGGLLFTGIGIYGARRLGQRRVKSL